MYDLAAIKQGLPDPFFADKVHFFEQIDSTNIHARQLAEHGAPTGTVVVANAQTRGRGRYARRWSSPPDVGLWFSLLTRPHLPPDAVSRLPVLVADVILPVFAEYAPGQFEIKLPNDILSNGRKVCGILCESSILGETVQYVVIGMGINVRQTTADFSPELRDIATSLRLITNREVDRIALLGQLLRALKSSEIFP